MCYFVSSYLFVHNFYKPIILEHVSAPSIQLFELLSYLLDIVDYMVSG